MAVPLTLRQIPFSLFRKRHNAWFNVVIILCAGASIGKKYLLSAGKTPAVLLPTSGEKRVENLVAERHNKLSAAADKLLSLFGGSDMVHYTCDMCGKTIGASESVRYRVYVEIEEHPAGEQESDYEDEYDQYDDAQEYEQPGQPAEEELYRSFKFDLCSECVDSYVKEPLPKSLRNRVFFNDN